MFEVRQTVTFRDGFGGVRDLRAQAQIVRRIERAQAGNLGDTAAVGEFIQANALDAEVDV